MNVIPRQFDFTDRKLQAILADAEAHSVQCLGDYENEVIDLLSRGDELSGIKFPWGKTHGLVRLRYGEVSVWAGINGHRKSTLLNQVALWATRECPVGICSLEMPVPSLAKLMVTQAAGAPKPTADWAKALLKRIGNRMWFYDRLGSVPPIELLGAVHALNNEGCRLMVIDCLQMARVSDDMERERLFMSELVSLAKALDVHVALVHHVRKPQSGGDEYVPSRFDVKGNGAIIDLAQNLFICWANKARARVERKVEHNMTLTDAEQKILDDEPDQKLIVAKQRHAEFEGPIHLWHHPSRQFTATNKREPLRLEVS